MAEAKPFAARGSRVFVSSITSFELWYGVAKSSLKELNTRRLEVFFAGPLQLLGFCNENAQIAGPIRAALEAAGTPIGAYDLLIASQALRHKLTLVTANVSEFARIKRLVWEDWAKPPRS